MVTPVAARESLVLFHKGNNGVVIDTEFNVVVETGDARKLITQGAWKEPESTYSESVTDLAEGALSLLDIAVTAAAGRMYTIPKGVQNEAKKGLAWRKEYKRGGTPVGMNTARRLADGGQIGLEKIRHIAKYFPRHEIDKKAKGYEPGEDGFPSRGRIAWALWGGDAGWRWAQAIVDRENKKALTSDGYATYGYKQDYSDYEAATQYGADVDSFKDANYMDENVGPEFMVRVRMDGSGIDRLYRIDIDGSVFVWDGDSWDDMGNVENDVYAYDKELDTTYDNCEKDYVMCDAASAVIISARMQQQPFQNVSVADIDMEEAQMVADAINDVDWGVVDYALTAAGEEGISDGYTSEERSEAASKQVRDANGKFAAQGSRVVIGGDPNQVGAISKLYPENQTVDVLLDDGSTVNVPANTTQTVQSYMATYAGDVADTPPLDVSGILGEPRTPIDRPNARIPGTLPAMTASDMQSVLYDWPAWVKSQRDSFQETAAEEPDYVEVGKMPAERAIGDNRTEEQKNLGEWGNWFVKSTGANYTHDAYDHPMLQDWLSKKETRNGKTVSPNTLWYSPIISSGEEQEPEEKKELKKNEEMTPTKSDVAPIFAAIVSPDDPRAVLDLISIVPAGSTSNLPMTYKRVSGEWVRDEGIISDLNSATPPPVVPLDSKTLEDVVEQVDASTEDTTEAVTASVGSYSLDHMLMVLWGPIGGAIESYGRGYSEEMFEDTSEEVDEAFDEGWDDVFAMLAAGGVDRNRGNAERLRRYWLYGKGAAKIRWNTPGDWTRCVRYLRKYMGPRAKGYCQLRHKEATGVYTGSRGNVGKKRGRNNSVEELLTKVTVEDLQTPVDQIGQEPDEFFDDTFEPMYSIVESMKALGEMEEDEYKALVAAGGLDRNRGGAEKLRRYWLYGKGAAKVRWNSGGDWYRCVRYLSKYMGPRAKGYCALRHKEATGLWTGDKLHRQLYGRKGRGRNLFSNDVLATTEQVLETAALNARMRDAKARVSMTAGGYGNEMGSGAKFYIPLVIPEELESGDGRKFEKGSIDIRELPLPLMWQIKTADGHAGSVVVGRIDRMERVDDGIGNAYGVFDSGEFGQEAERLVREGFIRGVSADMDKFEAQEVEEEYADNDGEEVKKTKLNITQARVMGVTIVPKPAFQECTIQIIDDENDSGIEQEDTVTIPDGVYVEEVDPSEAEALVASGIIAGAIPVVPPKSWFDKPELQKATPLTVTDDGRVFGHIAAWHVDHIGMAFGTRPPRSKSKYAYFHTGVIRTDEGSDVPVGQLTLAGGHAPLEASAVAAAKHYDDTASAVADVHAGEDAYGIWVAGSLRPGTTPEQVRALRASAPSGDWRPIKGGLELVAVCQVNVPGFPIARARVASGQVMALVAAGASTLAKMKSDPVAELVSRVEKLEQLEKMELAAKVAEVSTRFEEVRAERRAQLSAQAEEIAEKVFADIEYDDGFGYIPRRTRRKLAKEGKALPDGSYPITNIDSLKDSISAYGRGKKSKRAAIRRHIMKRARQLKRADLIPEKWKNMASDELSVQVDDLRSRIASFSAATNPVEDAEGKALAAEREGKYTPETQPRDVKGKFRQVLARIKQDAGDGGLQNVLDKIEETENFDETGDYVEAARSATDLIGIIDRIDSGALNPRALENVRMSARELGETVANLPLPFGADAEKVRYSDLPPALRDLVDDMIVRVEDKIGKEDADVATKGLRSFMSGGDYLNQSEVSSELSKLLRLLT